MKTLQLEQAHIVLRLTDTELSAQTLSDQTAPFLVQSPNLVLDVRGVQFNSMLIGELVNLYRSFEAQWGERPHRIALVNLSDFSREVFHRAHLDQLFTLADSLGDALNGGA